MTPPRFPFDVTGLQPFKPRQDVVADMVMQATNHMGQRRASCWPFLGKGYVEGEYEFEITLDVSSRVVSAACEYSVILKRATDGEEPASACLDPEVPAYRSDLHRRVPGERAADRHDALVLVVVPEAFENPQWVPTWVSLAAIERLKVCDDGADSGIDRTQVIQSHVRPSRLATSTLLIFEDGERDALIPGRVVESASEGPEEIVEAGANVMDRVAGQQTEVSRRMPDDLSVREVAALFTVVLSDVYEGIAFQEHPDFAVELLAVHKRVVKTPSGFKGWVF
jgi:hypothetical protein